MSDAAFSQANRLLTAVCTLVVCGAIAAFAVRSLGQTLWLDELLTMALVGAQSLPKLWAGIVSGIDGNPPMYLTLAWLIAHAVPSTIATDTALTLANIGVTAAALVALYRVGLRAVSRLAAWIGAFAVVILNDRIVVVALELRTYALYFLAAALAVLFQQRLLDRGRARDVVVLALVHITLTLSHTFGIAYVATIALAGALSAWPHARHRSKLTAVAAGPALIAFACWSPFLMQQSAVGRPYFWFGAPGLAELLQALFSSPIAMGIAILELYGLAGVAVWRVRTQPGLAQAMRRDERWQPRRHAVLLVLGLSGLTLTVWIVSAIWFPMFVPRYFTPQLIVGFILHAATADLLVWLARERLKAGFATFATLATIVPPALLGLVLLSNDPDRRQTPCADGKGLPFETDFVTGDMAVVVESPHIFLPRARYASHGDAYRFPLDWDVVLNYRDRTRGNAADFHIMQNLKSWANLPSILSTDDIVRTLPRFLAIAHSSRAWFHNLQQTRDVTADKLAEVSSPDGGTCTLWKVTRVEARQ